MNDRAPGRKPNAGAESGSDASAAETRTARWLIAALLLATAALDLTRCGLVMATARHPALADRLVAAGLVAAAVSIWIARASLARRRWSIWAALLIGAASAPQAARAGDGHRALDRSYTTGITRPLIREQHSQCATSRRTIGSDMTRFPTPGHLVSWAKFAPKTRQSAGRSKAATTGQGNPWLGGTIGEAATSAARTSTFLAAATSGSSSAAAKARLVAVGNDILSICWHGAVP